MARAKNGDIVMKDGTIHTGKQGGKDRRKIVGRVPKDVDLDSLPTCAEPGRLPEGAYAVKVPGGYRRL
jgi:hypothetical protein